MVVIRYGGIASDEASTALVLEDANTFGWYLHGASGVQYISRDPKVKLVANNGDTTLRLAGAGFPAADRAVRRPALRAYARVS
jgi:hypothetical protein